jgi:hypothetical protein
MTDDELLSALNDLRTLMINVATGGPRINDVNGDYQRVFASVAADLARRSSIELPAMRAAVGPPPLLQVRAR